jgi:hypothetical protein
MRRVACVISIALAGVVACGSNEGPPDAHVIDAPPPGGTVTFTWTIHSDTGATLACSDISAQSVSIAILNEAAGFGTNDLFSCGSGTGTTGALAPGMYTLTIELDGGAGALATPQKLMHVAVESGKDTALGNIDFTVDAHGGLQMTLVAQGATSNCGAGGAGIDNMTMQLQTASGTCIPATFMIAGSPYTSDCNTLPPHACIEKDQQITVTGLPSGQLKLLVVGDVGGKACWSGVDFLTVPAMQQVKDYGAVPIGYDNAVCPRVDAM